MTASVSVVHQKQWCCFALQKFWTGASIVANSKRSCCFRFAVVVVVVVVVRACVLNGCKNEVRSDFNA